MGEREGSSWSQARKSVKNLKSVMSIGTSSKLGLRSEGVISLRRMKLLKEIFDFYSKQTSLLGRNPTFD